MPPLALLTAYRYGSRSRLSKHRKEAASQCIGELLTIKEVAKLLGVHPTTVGDWWRAGKLRGIKISRRVVRIPLEDVQALLAKGRTA